MQIREIHQLFLNSSGICTDSRKPIPNCLFFALKGTNFNGNEFVQTALEDGAIAAILDEDQDLVNPQIIPVENALQTLQELARFHREYLKVPILALTGSNGKTTTKELILAVLSKKFQCVATQGNLNNHIGVPLTLLSMNESTDFGIVEMGANHPGEIAFLCEIAQPNFGYITNFGKAHIEGFGGMAGVIKAKSELYDFLKAEDRMIFINSEDPIQQKQKSYFHTFSFGTQDSDLHVEYPNSNTYAEIRFEDHSIQSQLIGDYNSRNLAAAFSIGINFQVPLEAIKTALETYIPSNNRSQILEKNSNKFILDAYNANPTSMAAALDNLETMPQESKMVILGDMFELGTTSTAEHQNLVTRLEQSKIDKVYLIGEHFWKTQAPEKIQKFETFEAFKTHFKPQTIQNTLILIKGSRGMALERVVELL